MEHKDYLTRLTELSSKISELPKGYISKKTVSGNVYFYHQWTEGGVKQSRFFKGKSLTAQQIIRNIGDYLRIGLKRAFIAEHFDEASVGVVGRYLSVMHHGVFQQRKGMGTAPPAGGV